MSKDQGSGSADVIGRPVADAVEAVLAEDSADSRDRETVRTTLERVAEDGVVSESGIEAALAELSKVVSTPETRIEFAAIELADARETAEAEGVADLEIVRSRMDAFESRLNTVQARIDGLGPELRELIDRRDEGDVYAVATGSRELEAEANELHRAADELGVELEEFGRWLTDPGTRYDELEEEVEAVEDSLEGLAGTVEELATAVEGDDEGVTRGAARGAPPADPGVAWADATLRTRVTSLLVADLRVELADLRGWPSEAADGADTARLDDAEARLDRLGGRCRSLAERLDGLARPAWTDRFGDRLDGFEAAMEEVDPPVDWGEVEAELERYREDVGAA